MDDERKVLMVFGIIVALAAIVSAAAGHFGHAVLNLVLWFNPGVSFGNLGDLEPRGPVILSVLTLAIVGLLSLVDSYQ